MASARNSNYIGWDIIPLMLGVCNVQIRTLSPHHHETSKKNANVPFGTVHGSRDVRGSRSRCACLLRLDVIIVFVGRLPTASEETTLTKVN